MKRIKNHDIENFFVTMRRCTKCILPETFPGIEFDEDGVCNYCKSYEPINVFGEKELKKILVRYKNKGEKYDCVVGISGGRDSAFVLHQMIKKYKMRTLALTVDSGAIAPEGVCNIERITKILNVDHVYLRDEKQIRIAKENVKKKFHGWLKYPSINTIVPVLNSGDKTMNLRMAKYVKENNIPLVIGGNTYGSSAIEHDHYKTGFLGVFPDERGRYSVSDKIKILFHFGYEYLKVPYNYNLSVFQEYAKGAAVYYFEPILKPKRIECIGFYDYIYWNETEILSTICNELNWQGASDTTTTWRIDDAAYPLMNYLYYRIVGFSEHVELLSKMIREGQISREEGLRRYLSEQKPRIPTLMRMFEELDVTKEQVDEAIEQYRIGFLDNLLSKHYGPTVIT